MPLRRGRTSRMLCKIADLLVEVPADGGMDARCAEYLYDQPGEADINITTDM